MMLDALRELMYIHWSVKDAQQRQTESCASPFTLIKFQLDIICTKKRNLEHFFHSESSLIEKRSCNLVQVVNDLIYEHAVHLRKFTKQL